MSLHIYTVGHSTHSIDRLLELLSQHQITAVADVRSAPYSRMNPQFNRESVKDALHGAGITYVFLGKELGARSEDRSCYCNGRVQYDKLAATARFKRGLGRVKESASTHRIALMCSEKDPLHCHRTLLVARYLVDDGLAVSPILADGCLEEHDQALARLTTNLKLGGSDFFRSGKEVEEQAYSMQGQAIAYDENSSSNSKSVA